MAEELSTLMIGNTVPVGIATRMYEAGASKVHAISDSKEDIFYVVGTWGNDERTGFSRARRKSGKEYEILSSDVIAEKLSPEKERILLEQLADIFGGAVDQACANGKLFKVNSPEKFYLLPKDNKLVGELDSLLVILGLDLDELYKYAKQKNNW
jgi:hypothetical protein